MDLFFNFNPLNKLIESYNENKKLYERLVQAEKEKVAFFFRKIVKREEIIFTNDIFIKKPKQQNFGFFMFMDYGSLLRARIVNPLSGVRHFY